MVNHDVPCPALSYAEKGAVGLRSKIIAKGLPSPPIHVKFKRMIFKEYQKTMECVEMILNSMVIMLDPTDYNS